MDQREPRARGGRPDPRGGRPSAAAGRAPRRHRGPDRRRPVPRGESQHAGAGSLELAGVVLSAIATPMHIAGTRVVTVSVGVAGLAGSSVDEVLPGRGSPGRGQGAGRAAGRHRRSHHAHLRAAGRTSSRLASWSRTRSELTRRPPRRRARQRRHGTRLRVARLEARTCSKTGLPNHLAYTEAAKSCCSGRPTDRHPRWRSSSSTSTSSARSTRPSRGPAARDTRCCGPSAGLAVPRRGPRLPLRRRGVRRPAGGDRPGRGAHRRRAPASRSGGGQDPAQRRARTPDRHPQRRGRRRAAGPTS